MRILAGVALSTAIAAGASGALSGQDGRPPSADTGADAPVLDREVFFYPGGSRRDPFLPLLPGNSAGPRFEELRLIGVVLSPDPQQSVALLQVGSTRQPSLVRTGGQTFRVRQDTVLGELKILRVERERVVVEINQFDVREENELVLDPKRGSKRR